MKRSKCWLGLLAALSVPSAGAVNQEIRALFQPDSSQPQRNVFINKTPNSGYCATYPGECADNNMFSIQLPIRFESIRAIAPDEGISLKVPANWRQLTITNMQTQETETVEVRIIGIGSRYILSDSATHLTGETDTLAGHQKLWTSNSWVYAPMPCQYSGVGAYTPATYRFFWKAPVESPCTKVATFRIPSMSFDTLDFAYELRTPNPLGMSSGLYTGPLSYTIGPGGDFDLGPLMNPDDGNLILDFVLDVQHTLKVDIPPGGNRVLLEPQGGWQSWLEQGRKPVRLYRDQIFNISASSKFTMRFECELDLDTGCAILDRESGYAGGVNVSVSLPNGLTDSTGQPVRRLPLSRTATSPFQPRIYVDRKPGTLHFEMGERDTNWLIINSKGRPYKGNITVIWDSEV
ncbi:hypothetical protein [Pseudomonas fluorescens]|uniref:Uncharacterized protein n=1 Tax=Pseudomonas fluorescens TaxID=294 RepID=A0A0F4V888_PSEFL|nr:hypothetical protein [Pseudomonas fluorescens]KJZ64735.1 hypothetical protein VD17_16190 [Pseudomonas fluorescens]